MADVILSLWLQILLFYSATSPAGVLRQNLGCSSIAHGELVVVGVEVVKSSMKDFGTGLSACQQPVTEAEKLFVIAIWEKPDICVFYVKKKMKKFIQKWKFCHNLLTLMLS